jgi:phospholipase/lecithinase/hemolysin
MSRLLIAASTAVLLSSLPSFATTSPYSAIYSFGDSLSDVGNLYQATPFPDPPTPHQPLYPYSEGRFSNGPLWVQDLSAGLGLGPVTPSLLGGNDYAFGGATTGTTDAHAATLIDLPTQIAEFGAFLASHPAVDPSTALYTLSIGANDIFAIFDDLAAGDIVDPTSVIDEAAANLAAAASQLQSDGAKDLVLFDVPNLGLTPAFNTNPTLSAEATALAYAFNAQVQTDLAPVETARLKVYDLDTFTLLSGAVGDPGAAGFTNATDPCWTGTDTGGPSSGSLCSDTFAGQNQYLFWDDVHPTAGGHLLVANDALEQLGFPPLLAPIPEPSTWFMMALGFAGLGALGARKVRTAAMAA